MTFTALLLGSPSARARLNQQNGSGRRFIDIQVTLPDAIHRAITTF